MRKNSELTDYWNYYSFKAGIPNLDKYISDIQIINSTYSENHYPILFFPKRLIEQISLKPSPPLKLNFRTIINPDGTITINENKDREIYLDENFFERIFQELNIVPINNEPIKPKSPTKPKIEDVPKNYQKRVNKLSSFSLFISALLLFVALLGFGMLEIDGAIIYLIVWLLTILFVFKVPLFKKDFWFDEDSKVIEYSLSERQEILLNMQEQYQKEFELYSKTSRPKYQRALNKYNENQILRYVKLNEHFPTVVKHIWKSKIRVNKEIGLNITQIPPQRGKYEDALFYRLMQIYPKNVKIDMEVLGKFPDLVYVDDNCCIDIEIDEPYDFITKKEVHFIGCGDESRNSKFYENNWFVLRFSESQIKSNINECLKIIDFLILFIQTGDCQYLNNLKNISDQIKSERWTKEEARLMRLNNSRS